MKSTVASLLLCVLACGPGFADGPRAATLTVKRDLTCYHPGFTDHMISTDTVPLTLPEISGPVSGNGQYGMQGNGYVLAGAAVYSGQVKDDSELVLTAGQWFYNGKGLASRDPAVPTAAVPVRIPLEPGGIHQASHDWVEQGIRCQGSLSYQIDFERETQVWDVILAGHSRTVWHEKWNVHDPKTGGISKLLYTHGFKFVYQMGVEATLEKRKGQWQLSAATVTAAQLKPEYEQSQPIYTVLSQTCIGCTAIAGLKGQALAGKSDGKELSLKWPEMFREATVNTKFALSCPPGPDMQSCLNKANMGSQFSWADEFFLELAREHRLELADGSLSFSAGKPQPSHILEIRHVYTLKRIK